MLLYRILRRATPPANLEKALWLKPRKGKRSQVKRKRITPETFSAYTPLLREIMMYQARELSSQLQNAEKREIENHTIKPTFLSSSSEETILVRDGPTNHSFRHCNKKGPDKTCPRTGVIFTQNIQGLSGKDRKLKSLLDQLIEIMISNRVMIYCVQETWVLGNLVMMLWYHMVIIYNMGEKDPGSKGMVEVGVSIILSPTAVISWREAWSKTTITTLLGSSFAGSFIVVKLSFTNVYQWGKSKIGYLKP